VDGAVVVSTSSVEGNGQRLEAASEYLSPKYVSAPQRTLSKRTEQRREKILTSREI